MKPQATKNGTVKQFWRRHGDKVIENLAFCGCITILMALFFSFIMVAAG